MERRVGMEDVAVRAGVSRATVSNALNHPERVSPRLLSRVQQAMTELAYVRNEQARHLRSGRSTTVGLLLLDAHNPGFFDMAEGIEDVLTPAGWTVLMGNSGRNADRETRLLRAFAEQRTAGIIIAPHDGMSAELTRVRTSRLPLVLLDRRETGTDLYSVSVDDGRGGRAAVDHLIELGHRHVAFVGSPAAAIPVQERLDGVRRGVAGAGEPVELEVVEAALSIEGGRLAGQQLARRPGRQRPTAVIAAIDLIALGILQSFGEAGLRVPDDVSLCGYDDADFARQLTTPLTSVRRPHRTLGRSAGRLLLELLEGRQPSAPHVRHRPTLVVRASTAAPPSSARARR